MLSKKAREHLKYILFFNFFFFFWGGGVALGACGSSWARNQTCASVGTCTTPVAIADLYPAAPYGNFPNSLSLKFFSALLNYT